MEIKKQNIILILGAFFIVASDQLSKYWAHTIKGRTDFLFLSFKKFYNPGISFDNFQTESHLLELFFSPCFLPIFLVSTIIIFYF